MSILLLLLTCAPHTVPPLSVGTSPASRSEGHLRLPGLVDVGCAGTECVALVGDRLLRLPDATPLPSPPGLTAFDTLRAVAAGWEVEGPCPSGRCVARFAVDADAIGPLHPGVPLPLPEAEPRSLTDAAEAATTAWNTAIRSEWRSSFGRVAVAPGGGRLTFLRGVDGAGTLVRAGGGSRAIRVATVTTAANFPAWIALHPTGTEAYLVVWPSPWVRAFDPSTLASRWTLLLDGAAQGLFVDATGRWLLVGVGAGGTDRLTDWALPAVDSTDDPARDEVLRAQERPTIQKTLVIDLASHTVAAEAEGSLRRCLRVGDQMLLATDRAIVTFRPEAPAR